MKYDPDLNGKISSLVSNHSAVKREQIIFTVDMEKVSRLLIAKRAKYRNNRFTNKRGRKTTYKLSNTATIITYLKITATGRGKDNRDRKISRVVARFAVRGP